MGFAAIARVAEARVSEESWTVCAVLDTIGFGIAVGDQLHVNTTLCIESMTARAPIVIDHASRDPKYCNHPTRNNYNIESYISMPIILPNGQYFGNLFAIDRVPRMVSDSRAVFMFKRIAHVLATQLDVELARDRERTT